MKDQVFVGRNLSDAVRLASEALGVVPGNLRYVVLDQGAEAGLGLAARPAQIAVMLGLPRVESAAVQAPAAVGVPPARDARSALERCVEALLEAGDLAAAVSIEESSDQVSVRIEGADAPFFLQQEAEVLDALEHVLQRVWLQSGERRRLRVSCQGQGASRDEAVRKQARQMAEQAMRSGEPQESAPLNAYERRLIHVELAAEAGLRTFSVGEGRDRRVTVAPAGDATDPKP
jgi:spoIIIJ-associated protein